MRIHGESHYNCIGRTGHMNPEQESSYPTVRSTWNGIKQKRRWIFGRSFESRSNSVSLELTKSTIHHSQHTSTYLVRPIRKWRHIPFQIQQELLQDSLETLADVSFRVESKRHERVSEITWNLVQDGHGSFLTLRKSFCEPTAKPIDAIDDSCLNNVTDSFGGT